VAAAYPDSLPEPKPAVREAQVNGFDPVQEENKQLRELVVQLSRLVVKYVMTPAASVDGLPSVQTQSRPDAAKMLDPKVPASTGLHAGEVVE
jgi:hypothetical protein